MSLNFEAFYAEVIYYFQHNIYITIALAGILFLLMFRKPKLFFILAMIVAINLSFLYVISYTSSLGVIQKKNLMHTSKLHVRAY